MFKWFFGKKQETNQEKKKSEQDEDDLPISDFTKDYEDFLQLNKQQIKQLVDRFNYFEWKPQERHVLGYPDGGKLCGDLSQVKKIRSIASQVIKQIGRQILSGKLNLTKISFPIKAMFPKTSLQNSLTSTYLFPLYINKACTISDVHERFRLSLTALTMYFYFLNMFLKPLNPIIGQTLQAAFPDGTKMYAQQISHHPPISYFYVVGPQQNYKFYGYYDFAASAGLNSMTLKNSGRRTLVFKDGQRIQSNFCDNLYSGALFGDLRQQSENSILFEDKANKLSCKVEFGKIKKRPTDYFGTKILKNGKLLDDVIGSYMSHLDISGKRYFDGRYVKPFKPIIITNELQSDFSLRSDIQQLKMGKVRRAQKEKETLEDIQRNDAKLRKNSN